MQSSRDAVSNLQRLHQQQVKILEGIDARLTQLRRFADDYKTIDGFVEDLPKRLSYRDAIIPFGGPKGLVRGQLVNTNELLVFLGADHFATMTCYQARQLISRRSESIKLQIDACSEERRLFAERMNFTSAFTKEQVGEDGEGVVDIKEEVDEEEEKKWMDRHRQFLQQKRWEEQRDNDEDLWRRLEQLEMEEDEDEEKTIEVVEAKKDDVHGILLSPRRKSTDRGDRHVRFSVTDDQDDDDDDDDGEEQRIAVIRFRHSPTAGTAASSETITPASIVQDQRKAAGDCVPALAATVVERQTDATTDAVSETSRRPVSRFRAQRLGKRA